MNDLSPQGMEGGVSPDIILISTSNNYIGNKYILLFGLLPMDVWPLSAPQGPFNMSLPMVEVPMPHVHHKGEKPSVNIKVTFLLSQLSIMLKIHNLS